MVGKKFILDKIKEFTWIREIKDETYRGRVNLNFGYKILEKMQTM